MANLRKNKQYYADTEWTVKTVGQELDSGLKLLKKIDRKIVAIFGGHKVKDNQPYYQHCEKLAFELGKKGYAIITGGGSGIMEAANSGAMKAGTDSIGIKANLLKKEWIKGNIFTHRLELHFLFVRRFILSIKSEALVFYPGGFGTLNELFEYATLMKTGVVDKVPMICVGRKYWKGLFDWLKNTPQKEGLLNHPSEDMDLLYMVDDLKDIIRIIERKKR
jgi:uncharacterized protein (TIGR00730 family)